MKNIVWSDLDAGEREALFAIPDTGNSAREAAIEIVEAVRREGTRAVLDYARRLDGFRDDRLRISEEAIEQAFLKADGDDIAAMQAAIAAVRKFHTDQGLTASSIETWPGIQCERRVDPLSRVGLYVPAGSAPLVSTLIMLAVPAKIAGVPEIIVTVPPGRTGQVDQSVLTAAKLLGLDRVYAVGGAQAIAAMTFGAAEVPRVDKIFGPGNAWVAAAKAYVSTLPGGPAIDLPAGPSEVMVLADETARPDFVAADLLAQAEHDPMARVTLVISGGGLPAIKAQTQRQLAGLPRRAIAAEALEQALFISVEDTGAMIEAANLACPEHLIVQTQDARKLAERVRTAGSIFIGPWSPESMGDYAAGPNHTLPTGGAGRAWSGVTVEAFQRSTTLIEASREGVRRISPCVERLAQLEGLDAHAIAMRLRREEASDG